MKYTDIVGVCERCGELIFDLTEIYDTPENDIEICEKCVYQEAYNLYQEFGQSAVEDYGDKLGLKRRYCEPCEAMTPDLNGSCLVCGSLYRKNICPRCGFHYFTHNDDGSCVEDD